MVSVVITTYGRTEDVVLRAVESVKNQTYINWDLYIVDDNKADNPYSEPIKKALEDQKDERLHYIRMEKNSGACAARNRGIQESKGEYIAFLDDDDEWVSDKLEKQIAVLQNEDIGFVYCGLFLLNEKEGSKKPASKLFVSGNVYSRLLRDNFIGGTSEIVIKRECINVCGGFREDMPSSQDYEMWLRLSKKYNAGYVPENLVILHLHEGDSITKSLDRRIEGYRKIIDAYYDDIITIKKNHSYQLYNLGKFLILNKQSKEGWEYLKKAIKLTPIFAPYYIAVIMYWKINYK